MDYLTAKLGMSIVGKFSHSIPSTYQIQKALEKMKLCGNYSWKYINAKHVAIKVENEVDYARILVGENGMPVWMIEHHPMRVFKWTPDFDPFFETPITAVWCNIISLPMHLFDEAALFLIGGLLGKPIQADYATANQSRMSFARICVEIDISKPVEEEVTVEYKGKEVTMKVKWDKIPLYCKDCKHVGHSNSMCYAFGKKEKPPRKYFHQADHPPHREYGQYNNRNIHVEETENDRGDNDNQKGQEHKQGNTRREQGGESYDRGYQHNTNGWEYRKQGKKKGNKQQQGRRTEPHPSNYKPAHETRPRAFEDVDQMPTEVHPTQPAQKRMDGMGTSNRPITQVSEALEKFASPSYFNQLSMDPKNSDYHDTDTHMEEGTAKQTHEKGKDQKMERNDTGQERNRSTLMETNSSERENGGFFTSNATLHA